MQGTVEATVESIRTLQMPLTQSGRVIHCVSYKLAHQKRYEHDIFAV